MLLRVGPLPDQPLDAAAEFMSRVVPQVRGSDSAIVTCLFDPASPDHTGWRLAAVQSLARELAPRRINAIAGVDAKAIISAQQWLASAEGITGQYLPLDGAGAGNPLSSSLRA